MTDLVLYFLKEGFCVFGSFFYSQFFLGFSQNGFIAFKIRKQIIIFATNNQMVVLLQLQTCSVVFRQWKIRFNFFFQ